MPIKWTEDLATGVSQIDDQHKEIFRRIDGFLDACNQGKGKNEVDRVIKFLDDYVVTHFGTEEKYMIGNSFPDYSAHKEQHSQFIKSFSDLKRQLKDDGPGVHIVVMTNLMVVNWFVTHIRKIDTKLGAFLKTRI
jgi:hemerythrin